MEDSRVPFWSRFQSRNEVLYRINEQHPMVVELTSRLESQAGTDLLRLLEVAGSALPMDALFADMGGAPTVAGNASTSDGALSYAAITTFRYLTRTEGSAESVLAVMRDIEPFRSNWQRTQEILSSETAGRGDRGLGVLTTEV